MERCRRDGNVSRRKVKRGGEGEVNVACSFGPMQWLQPLRAAKRNNWANKKNKRNNETNKKKTKKQQTEHIQKVTPKGVSPSWPQLVKNTSKSSLWSILTPMADVARFRTLEDGKTPPKTSPGTTKSTKIEQPNAYKPYSNYRSHASLTKKTC